MADLSFWDGAAWVSLQGPKGDKGDPGKDGSGVTIVGTLTGTGTALPAANAGDMYILGDPVPTEAPASVEGPAQPGDGLVFNGSAWTNVGAIRGPKGDTGDEGPKGDPGIAASIAVGTVTGLGAGATPTIVNSGTSSAAKFDFGIPAGAKGDKGDPGTAATATAGTATALAAGAAPTVTNSGTTAAAVFNFGIPAGEKGDKGDPGDPGAPGADGETPVEVIKAATAPAVTAGKALSFWIAP